MATGSQKILNQVSLRVFRYDPEEGLPAHYDTFPVEVRPGLTVLEGLLQVAEGQDPSLAFRYSCRGAVCGSCAMYINGHIRLACQTQLQDLASVEVLVAPLPHLPVLKDLVVDMEPFYRKFEEILPYLISKSAPEKEFLQTPKERKALDEVTDCIWCAACYSSCPINRQSPTYLGPAALTQAYRFAADTRDQGGRERLKAVDREEGLWRCHTVFNCVEVCPKKINQTRAIEGLRRKALRERLKLWPRNR